MTSKNHQFLTHSDQVVKRYTKTVLYRLSGYRLDPYRPENRLDWLLSTPEANLHFELQSEGRPIITRAKFTYEDEVLELYSKMEVRIFERLNKAAIESGLLKEYNEASPNVNTDNMLTDDQVKEIAAIKQIPALNKRLATITSNISLDRIENAARDTNRSIGVIKAIENRRNELSKTD